MSTFEQQGNLWLPSQQDTSRFRKAPPPKLGPQHVPWQGRGDLGYYELPGGNVLQFDLTRLTLSDYRTMRSHYQINMSLQILTFVIHSIDWRIECDDKRIADFCDENMREMWTRFMRAISQAWWAGYSPINIEWTQDRVPGKITISNFKDLVPEECQPEWKEINRVNSDGSRVKLYEYDGINHRNTSQTIPKEATLWYPVLKENGDIYGRKLLKPAFAPWFFSQLIHLFANRYFERFGEPLPVGRAPFDDSVDVGGTTKTGKEIMEGIVSNIRNRAAVVLPADRAGGSGDSNDFEYTIDYLESQMRGADFERYLARLDEEMSLAMFMPVLLFRTSDIGSYNLGQAHEQLFFMMVEGLVGDIAEYLEKYALNRLVDFNYGPNAPRAHFRWRKLGKTRDETLRAVVQASIQQNHIRPNVTDLGEAIGLTLEEIEVLSPDGEAPTTEGGTETGGPGSTKIKVKTTAPTGSDGGEGGTGDGDADDDSGRGSAS